MEKGNTGLMELNLNIDKLAGPGRRRQALAFEVVRDLQEADFAQLAVTDRGTVPNELKRITDRHHSLARLLAAGVKEAEAGMIVGLTLNRVSIIKNSPAFIELLALYRREVDTEFSSTIVHMAGLGKDAVLELRERLENEPQKFSNRELMLVVTDMADRADIGEGADKLPTVIELVPQPLLEAE